MFARITFFALGLSVLGAGALALTPPKAPGAEVFAPQPAAKNVTIIFKNSIWPLKGMITMHPCAKRTCLEA